MLVTGSEGKGGIDDIVLKGPADYKTEQRTGKMSSSANFCSNSTNEIKTFFSYPGKKEQTLNAPSLIQNSYKKTFLGNHDIERRVNTTLCHEPSLWTSEIKPQTIPKSGTEHQHINSSLHSQSHHKLQSKDFTGPQDSVLFLEYIKPSTSGLHPHQDSTHSHGSNHLQNQDSSQTHGSNHLQYQDSLQSHGSNHLQYQDSLQSHGSNPLQYQDSSLSHGSNHLQYQDSSQSHGSNHFQYQDSTQSQCSKRLRYQDVPQSQGSSLLPNRDPAKLQRSDLFHLSDSNPFCGKDNFEFQISKSNSGASQYSEEEDIRKELQSILGNSQNVPVKPCQSLNYQNDDINISSIPPSGKNLRVEENNFSEKKLSKKKDIEKSSLTETAAERSAEEKGSVTQHKPQNQSNFCTSSTRFNNCAGEKGILSLLTYIIDSSKRAYFMLDRGISYILWHVSHFTEFSHLTVNQIFRIFKNFFLNT